MYYSYSYTNVLQVFCGIVIAMGIVMAVWDCGHLIITNSIGRVTSSQVVTLVPTQQNLYSSSTNL